MILNTCLEPLLHKLLHAGVETLRGGYGHSDHPRLLPVSWLLHQCVRRVVFAGLHSDPLRIGKILQGVPVSLANREPVATWSFKRLQLVKEPVKSNRTPNQEDAASTNETGTKWKLHDENKLSQHRTTIGAPQTCEQ